MIFDFLGFFVVVLEELEHRISFAFGHNSQKKVSARKQLQPFFYITPCKLRACKNCIKPLIGHFCEGRNKLCEMSFPLFPGDEKTWVLALWLHDDHYYSPKDIKCMLYKINKSLFAKQFSMEIAFDGLICNWFRSFVCIKVSIFVL